MNEHVSDRVENGRGLWALVLPSMQANIATLLKTAESKDLLLELPDLNFRLLAMLGSKTQTRAPAARREEHPVVLLSPNDPGARRDASRGTHPIRGGRSDRGGQALRRG